MTRGAWPEADREWLLELRCKYGIVYPHGGEILAAWTDRPRIGARLRRLACILTARGDDETVAMFHVSDINDVLAVLRPYHRRRLSPEHRAKSIETLARARTKRDRPVPQSDFGAAESTQQPDGVSTSQEDSRPSSERPEVPLGHASVPPKTGSDHA